MKNQINLTHIKNPLIKRALQKRRGEFMFNYGDYEDYSNTRKVGTQGKGKWYEKRSERNKERFYSEHCDGILYGEHFDDGVSRDSR